MSKSNFSRGTAEKCPMPFMAVSQHVCIFQDLRYNARKYDSVIQDQELSRVQPIHNMRVLAHPVAQKPIQDKQTDSLRQVKPILDTCSRLS